MLYVDIRIVFLNLTYFKNSFNATTCKVERNLPPFYFVLAPNIRKKT